MVRLLYYELVAGKYMYREQRIKIRIVMKYIDADRLKAEIERLGRNWDGVQELQPVSLFQADLYELLDIIDSLQQEQPEQPIKGYDEAYLNEKIAKASKTWEGVDVDKYMAEIRGYERPEVDLKKEIKEWVDLMVGASFPEQDGDYISEEDYRSVIRQTALHFCELGQLEMRHRITNPEYNAKVVEQLKSEYPARKED